MSRSHPCLLYTFAVFLAALLVFHTCINEATQRAHAKVLQRRDEEAEKPATKLEPNLSAFKGLCEVSNKPKHPCFTHWGSADLAAVNIEFDKKHLDPIKETVVKDNKWKDFTIKDPTQNFTLTYLGTDNTWLRFSNYKADKGCYDIELHVDRDSTWRFWVSDETDEQHNIDTENQAQPSGTICTKWLHLHAKEEGWGGLGF